jgi:putative component of toxin-antitoxin plasmid stabilization module
MHIKCKECSYCEEVNKDLFVKILGGVVATWGFWAWVSFFFAGTGFALPICIAIMTGGAAMLVYSNEIVAWLSDNYECPKCNNKNWVVVEDSVAKEIMNKKRYIQNLDQENKSIKQEIQDIQAENEKYQLEIKKLSTDLERGKNDIQEYFRRYMLLNDKNIESSEYIAKLENDFDFLMEELENKEELISELSKDNAPFKEKIDTYRKDEIKVIEKIKKRFDRLYPNIKINNKSYKYIASKISDDELLKFEQRIKELNDGNINFRDNIYGTDVKEVDFNKTGRIYIRKVENIYFVVCVGNKNTQDKDIDWLKLSYKG